MTSHPEPDAPAHVSAALDRLGLPLDEDYPVSQAAPAQPTPAQAEIEALVAVLKSRGRNNSLHDINRAADALTALQADLRSWRMASQEAELEVSALRKHRDALQADLAAAVARAEKAEGLATTQATTDVLAERARQINAEGWSADHDDAHFDGAIARAAASYALASAGYLRLGAEVWPWDAAWLKSTNQRRDMVKSVALGLAEIERLDRTALPAAAQNAQP